MRVLKNSSSTTTLSRDLKRKIQFLSTYISKNADIKIKFFNIQSSVNKKGAVVYMESVIDNTQFNKNILTPLMVYYNNTKNKITSTNQIDQIMNMFITVGQTEKISSSQKMLDSLFEGLAIVMIEGTRDVLSIDVRGGKTRALDEPLLDRTLCGPREGFVETLKINIALIRRKLKDPNFVIEKKVVGTRTRTDVAIMYIEDIADTAIVQKIMNKIDQINIDGMLSSGYLNQYIEDNPYSLLPQARITERTDVVVANLLEGRVAIMADQSPLVVIFPALFIEMFQAAEDYYEKPIQGSFYRIFRFLVFFIAISLPALYISLISFQHELIPYELIFSLAKSRNLVPFPVTLEVLLQEAVIQLVFEAGLRLPSPLGQTLGVVAGILLGQAAISANLASPAVIIVVSTAAISTFAIPNFCMAIAARVIRILMIILSSIFGLYGLSIGWLILFAHLTDLESVGIPYFAPFAPTRYSDLKDMLVRGFVWDMEKRPASVPVKDRIRQNKMKGKQ
ncbi:MAG: spore germination protein [Clostridia bacterium]|nr:spore germination protein [Clostridia bacterium]